VKVCYKVNLNEYYSVTQTYQSWQISSQNGESSVFTQPGKITAISAIIVVVIVIITTVIHNITEIILLCNFQDNTPPSNSQILMLLIAIKQTSFH